MAEGGQGMHHEWGKPDPMILIIDCLPCCWGTIQQQGDDTCRRGWRQGVPEKHAPCFKQVRPHRALPEAFPRPPTAWEKNARVSPVPPRGNGPSKEVSFLAFTRSPRLARLTKNFARVFPVPPRGNGPSKEVSFPAVTRSPRRAQRSHSQPSRPPRLSKAAREPPELPKLSRTESRKLSRVRGQFSDVPRSTALRAKARAL